MEPLLFLGNISIAGIKIPEQCMYALCVGILLSLLSLLATRGLAVYPGKAQNVMEVILGGFDSLLNEIMGHNGRKFFPLIATLGLFILTSNLIGLIPGF